MKALRILALAIPFGLAGCSSADLGLQPLFGPVTVVKPAKRAKPAAAVPVKPAAAAPVKPLSLLDAPECDMANLKIGCKDSAIGHVVKLDPATMVEMNPPKDQTTY